jgi:hypothetical protein
MREASRSASRPGWVSTRYVPPPGAEPDWYAETVAWSPALDVTLELVDGTEFSGTWIGPEPRPHETGALAMEFFQDHKLSFLRIPLADVVAFTVHLPAPPRADPKGLAFVSALLVTLMWDIPRALWALVTGRVQSPDIATEQRPIHVLVKAIILVERPDPELVKEVHGLVPVLRRLANLADLDYELPPDTREDTLVAYVLLRASDGTERDAVYGEALDVVAAALGPTEALPGVAFTGIGIGDR